MKKAYEVVQLARHEGGGFQCAEREVPDNTVTTLALPYGSKVTWAVVRSTKAAALKACKAHEPMHLRKVSA